MNETKTTVYEIDYRYDTDRSWSRLQHFRSRETEREARDFIQRIREPDCEYRVVRVERTETVLD
jgi:hypothetical protein